MKNRLEPALGFWALLSLYLCAGLIGPSDYLSSFSNPSIVVLTLLIVVAGVLSQTRITEFLGGYLGERKRNILATGAIVCLLSSFLSNTLVVQMFVRILDGKSYRKKLLLPISYLAILGGTTTLIGTSTNIIANGFLGEFGLQPFGFTDFLYVGLPLVVVGILYLALFSGKILPQEPIVSEDDEERFFLEAQVQQGSALHGKSVKENSLRRLERLFLAEIIRGEELVSPVTPHTVVLQGDILVFTGDIKNIAELERFNGLQIYAQRTGLLSQNLQWCVLSHKSDIVGKTIKQCNFRHKFNAAVVAIKRQGEGLRAKLGDVVLRAGDELVLAVGDDSDVSKSIKGHFYTMNDLRTELKFSPKQSALIFALFFGAIGFGAAGVLPFLNALLLLIFVYMLLGFLRFGEILRSVNLNLIVLLGSALGISKVLVQNGAAQALSSVVMMLGNNFGTYGVFVLLFFFTLLLSEFTLNASAVAIGFPIAFLVSQALGANPEPFIFAVTYGASASFLTKFGYQTNMLVAAAGEYKQRDFLRLGLPLSVIYSIVALVLIPVFFKF